MPRVATLAVEQTWIVVTLVQELEDTGQSFGFSVE
jgi:hypothetical protein